MRYTSKYSTKKHGAKKGKKKQQLARLSKVQPSISYRMILGFMQCIHGIWQAGVNTVNFVLFIVSSIFNFFVAVVCLPRTIYRRLTRRTRKTKSTVSAETEDTDVAEECSDPNEGLEAEVVDEELVEEYEIDEEAVATNDDARDEAIRALEDRVTQLEKALEKLRKSIGPAAKRGAIPVPAIAPVAPPVIAIPIPPPPPPPMPTPIKKANPIFVTPEAKPAGAVPNTASKPAIDIADIISQRGNLRSTSIVQRHRPMISLHDITNVKLKKSTGALSEKDRATNAPAPITLRKVDIVRSPGGTPMRRTDENATAKTSAKKASPSNSSKQSPIRKAASVRSPLRPIDASSPIRSPYKAIR